LTRNTTHLAVIGAAIIALPCAARAQFGIAWSTIDGGGGALAGGAFTLSGTIGQHDAAPPATGAPFAETGGYWAGLNACAADYDGNGVLAVADIFAYLNAWFAGNASTDFNGSGQLEVADIFAFLNAWFAGC
jgi:hypothetical protein